MFLGTKSGVSEYDLATVEYMLKSKPNEQFVVVDNDTILKGTGAELLVELAKTTKKDKPAEQESPVPQTSQTETSTGE